MPVKIHNKDYFTVAERIAKFHEDNKSDGLGIETQLISHDAEKVIMKALIMNGETIIATGYAEEFRDSSKINETSALENCETSAVGRALAFFGLAGTEIASADEVAAAITQQREKELYASFQDTTEANEENHSSLLGIREFLADENWSAAKEAWSEVSHDDQRAIWVATTKGGWFTTAERHLMKNMAGRGQIMFQHKPNNGSLFKNDKRETDSQPNAKGSALIDGVEYWISAWTNDGSQGKYQSLKFSRKDENKTSRKDYSETPKTSQDEYDGDLPF